MRAAAGVAFANLALAVMLGAFGTHALQERLAPDQLQVWRVGQSYHMGVAVAVLALFGMPFLTDKAKRGGAWALLAGTVLFAGSLYALALGAPRVAGAITPIGGATWIVTLLVLAVAAVRDKGKK
ncbi:MAG: DUF423 domain-containing protein [Fimbriimonadaceae bacterium]|nr:DUF423 domain-containing protein [Fimbriimonadaceae bacterium]